MGIHALVTCICCILFIILVLRITEHINFFFGMMSTIVDKERLVHAYILSNNENTVYA